MLRILVFHLFLFLLPFAGYWVWLKASRQAAQAGDWRDAPMLWLSIAGGVLVIVSLVALASFEDTPPDAAYQPLQYKDGQLVPGRLE